MSAFMVKDETINRVVKWLSLEVSKSQDLRDKLEVVCGMKTTSHTFAETLGQAMFRLNIAGVNERYGEGKAKLFRDLDYHYQPEHASEIQVLKSLECWLYQCTEGEVVKHPLYIFFDTAVRRYLMQKIINNLPEYQQAEWG